MGTETYHKLASLTDEYKTYVSEALRDAGGGAVDVSRLVRSLANSGAWTETGAQVVLGLATRYGAFVLWNALALAQALGIEDGSDGL